MLEAEMNALLQLLPDMVQKMEVELVLDNLIKFRVICQERKQIILSGNTSQQKARCLLDMLLKSDNPETFDIFLVALKEPYPFMCKALLKECYINITDDELVSKCQQLKRSPRLVKQARTFSSVFTIDNPEYNEEEEEEEEKERAEAESNSYNQWQDNLDQVRGADNQACEHEEGHTSYVDPESSGSNGLDSSSRDGRHSSSVAQESCSSNGLDSSCSRDGRCISCVESREMRAVEHEESAHGTPRSMSCPHGDGSEGYEDWTQDSAETQHEQGSSVRRSSYPRHVRVLPPHSEECSKGDMVLDLRSDANAGAAQESSDFDDPEPESNLELRPGEIHERLRRSESSSAAPRQGKLQRSGAMKKRRNSDGNVGRGNPKALTYPLTDEQTVVVKLSRMEGFPGFGFSLIHDKMRPRERAGSHYYITAMLPGSPADLCIKMCVNDTILAIDNMEIADMEIDLVLNYMKEQQSIVLMLKKWKKNPRFSSFAS